MISELLSKLDKVKQTKPNEWKACCPVHSEKTPSLGIKLTSEGKIIMHCFGCGASGTDVINAVGMDIADLFPPTDRVKYDKTSNKRTYFSADTVLKCLLYESSIISLAASDSANGVSFNHDDAKRIDLAHQRILEATTYCDK